jgi:hypothetical protein
MWFSWHDNVESAPMEQDYARLVDISNQGVKRRTKRTRHH